MSDAVHECGVASIASPFHLDCGRALARVDIAYETYGVLDPRGDNVILICHALTGSARVAGAASTTPPGWWDTLVGPGRAIDTNRWFVVCTNVLGGCYGSTGPTSIDHDTGAAFGASFPTITIRDMVRAQRDVVAQLGIARLHAVVGGSMGGMQVLEWAVLFPELIDRIVPIATAAQHSPWAVGFNVIAREALAIGESTGDVAAGLRLARKVAMMTYRAHAEFDVRFGRERDTESLETIDGPFDVERYLEHHGEKLVERFDAHTYRTITRAMDLHDLAWMRGDIDDVLASITHPALCVGISTDVLYPASEQRRLARSLANASYREIESPCGHDAFLIEHEQLAHFIRPFLEAPAAEVAALRSTTNSTIETYA